MPTGNLTVTQKEKVFACLAYVSCVQVLLCCNHILTVFTKCWEPCDTSLGPLFRYYWYFYFGCLLHVTLAWSNYAMVDAEIEVILNLPHGLPSDFGFRVGAAGRR